MNPMNVCIHQRSDGQVSFTVEDLGVVYEGQDALIHVHSVPNPKLKVSLEQKISSLSEKQLFSYEPLEEGQEYLDGNDLQIGYLVPLDVILKFCERSINAPAISVGRSVLDVFSKTIDVSTRAEKYIPSDPSFSEILSGSAKTTFECYALWQVASRLEALMAHSLCTLLKLPVATTPVSIGIISLVGTSIAINYEWDNLVDLVLRSSSFGKGICEQIPDVLALDANREEKFALERRQALSDLVNMSSSFGRDICERITDVFALDAEREEKFTLEWRQALENLFARSSNKERNSVIPLEYDLTLTGKEPLDKRSFNSSFQFSYSFNTDLLKESRPKSNPKKNNQSTPPLEIIPIEQSDKTQDQEAPLKTNHLSFSLLLPFNKETFTFTPPPPLPSSYWKDRIDVWAKQGHVSINVNFSQNHAVNVPGNWEGSIHDPSTWNPKYAQSVAEYYFYENYREKELQELYIAYKVMPNRNLGGRWPHKVHVDKTPMKKENPFDPKHPFQLAFAEHAYFLSHSMNHEVIGASETLAPFVEFHKTFYGEGHSAKKARSRCHTQEEAYFEDLCEEYFENQKHRGLSFLLNGKYKDAEKILKIYHELYPEDVDTCKALMCAYSGLNNDSEALSFASFLPPEEKDPAIELWIAQMHARLGQLNESLTAYRRYELTNPNDKTALFAHAAIALKGQETDKEEGRLLLLGLNTAPAWQLLALDAAQNNHWEDAVGFAEKDLSLKNFATELRQAASLNFEQTKEYVKSFMMLAPLAERAEAGEKTIYQYALADLAYKQNDLTKTLFHLAEGMKTDATSKKDELLSFEGQLQLQTGNVDKALESFQGYLKAFPNDFSTTCFCARLYQSQGDLTKAQSLYLGVLEKKPNHLESLIMLSEIYTKQHNYVRAAGTLEKALLVDPKQTWAHLVLGNLYIRENSFDIALVHLGKFLDAHPQNEQALSLMAIVYEATGQLDKAKEIYQQILKANPNSLSSKKRLQQVQAKIATRVARVHLEEKNQFLQLSSNSFPISDDDFPFVAATAPAYWFMRHSKSQKALSSHEIPLQRTRHTAPLNEESLFVTHPEAHRLRVEDHNIHLENRYV